jgi:hypothetical protein
VVIIEYSGLTFDWDDVSIEDEEIIKWLNYLCEEFGTSHVWYRKSSSGDGLHVIIADLVFNEQLGSSELCPMYMDSETQLSYRTLIPIECRGRLISDLHRQKKGFRTSRIFSTKNNSNVSDWKRFK